MTEKGRPGDDDHLLERRFEGSRRKDKQDKQERYFSSKTGSRCTVGAG